MSISVNVTAPARTIAVAQHIGTITISTANISVPGTPAATVSVGMRGLPGKGVPKGGNARAVMMKVNGDDYATDWAYIAWEDLLNKPDTATRWPSFGEVTGKPDVYPAEAHDHDGRYYTQQQLDSLLSGKLNINAKAVDADKLDGKQLATLEGEYQAAADQAEQNAKEHADTVTAPKLNANAYTAADVLAKLLTVAGHGSGLDADTLDGKQLATIEAEYRAFTNAAVAALVSSSPETLDTLNELAAALGNDPDFATTVSNQIGTKLNANAYTAADVLAKLLTVHGEGSGLNADKLDGLHAAAFALAVHGHTWAEVSGKPTTATRWPSFGEVTGKPSAYPAEAHDHDGRYYTQQQLDTLLSGKLNAAAYTAADLLAKLLTVDGAGSGLDADKLDGQESEYYRNAGNLTSGTLPDARLPSSQTGKTFTSPVKVVATFDVDGDGPGDQQDGIYIADLGGTRGATLNPTYTAALVWQISASRSNAIAIDSNGYLWGFRSHSNPGTYTFTSKTKEADNADTLDGKQLATIEAEYRAFANAAVAALVDASPATLDTLNELAAALGNDPNFAATVSQQIGAKLDATAKAVDSAKLDGKTVGQWGGIPFVRTDGVMEIGRFIDFHYSATDGRDYAVRLDVTEDGRLRLNIAGGGAHDIWHAGNDGHGSGMDADTLDGKHASEFATKIESVSIPTLSWPGNKIYVGQSVEIIITNYDSDTPYSVTATAGSISRSGDRILFVAPASEQTVTLTVGNRAINIPIETGVVTPRITVPASGDARVATSLTVATTAFEAYG